MRTIGLKMDVECNKLEILKRLKENRDNHKKIVEEARAGYLEEAIEFIDESLEYLEEEKEKLLNGDGEASLSPPRPEFSIPKDYTSSYNTAIQMLELHQGDTVTLTGEEVRTLVEDIWDWQGDFLRSASAYTNSASVYAFSKGL